VGPANLDRSNLYRDLFKDGTNDGQLGFGFPKASNHTPFNGFRIGFFHVSCIQMQNTEYMIDVHTGTNRDAKERLYPFQLSEL
jgi:hypothetical protein